MVVLAVDVRSADLADELAGLRDGGAAGVQVVDAVAEPPPDWKSGLPWVMPGFSTGSGWISRNESRSPTSSSASLTGHGTTSSTPSCRPMVSSV